MEYLRRLPNISIIVMQILENSEVLGTFEDDMQNMHQIKAARSIGLRVNPTVSRIVDIRCKPSGETTDLLNILWCLLHPLFEESSLVIAKSLSVIVAVWLNPTHRMRILNSAKLSASVCQDLGPAPSGYSNWCRR